MQHPYFYELQPERFAGGQLFLDIDGTLLPDGAADLPGPEVQAQIARLKAARVTIFLCSNGTDTARARAIATSLGVTYHETHLRKPNPESVRDIAPRADQAAFVVGDKMLTDGLLAHALGVPFVRVRTITSPNESTILRLIRAFDQALYVCARPFVRRIEQNQTLTIVTRVPTSPLRYDQYMRRIAYAQIQRFLFFITRRSRFLPGGSEQAVSASLCDGLRELGVAFRENPTSTNITDTVCVLEGVDTLRWALEQKSKGFIRTIIAGPTIVTAPTDENNLIRDSRIDMVVLPSEWNKRWWMTFDQLFYTRATVWAAGVADHGLGGTPDGPCIVYAKNADEKLFHTIIETLWTHKLPIIVSKYGEFHESEYLRLLKQARMVIYLSEYETQGITLREAWMAGVPTLVWNRGYFMYHEKRFEDATIGAPYLTPACGAQFTGADDFKEALIRFLSDLPQFAPRNYALAHHTTAISAAKYLEIVDAARGVTSNS